MSEQPPMWETPSGQWTPPYGSAVPAYEEEFAVPAAKRGKLPYVLGALGAVLFLGVGSVAVATVAGGSGAAIEIVEARPASTEYLTTTDPTTELAAEPVDVLPVDNPSPTRTTKPTVTKTGPTYKTPTGRDWLKITKAPADHAGERVTIYGRIGQFDGGTGVNRFLAVAGPTRYQKSASVETIFHGTKTMLADFVMGDRFQATAVVVGSITYQMRDGTVGVFPELRLKSIKAIS